jgi:hypothetical protein
MCCQGDGDQAHDDGCPTGCPTNARPTARPEPSHSLGLPDLPDLSWNRETSSSSSEGRRWGTATATASFASSRKTGRAGRAGRAVLENGWGQVGQQVGQCPTCPAGSVCIASSNLGSGVKVSNPHHRSDTRAICRLLVMRRRVEIDLSHQLHGGIRHCIGCGQQHSVG